MVSNSVIDFPVSSVHTISLNQYGSNHCQIIQNLSVYYIEQISIK